MLIQVPSEVVNASRLKGASSLAVLIVGMHRSGTSALSGVLNKLGVAAPDDLYPADQHNPRGYFEPERIIDFHERLLARLGSPSNDPLPLTYDWLRSPVGHAAAEELVEILDQEFRGRPMCLFKDPRICRLLPVWTAAIAESGRAAVAILAYRNPAEVARSLSVKAGLGKAYSLFMWLQHVLLGERFSRALPRSFAAYDDLMADWRAVSAKLQRELGVTWPRDLIRASPEVDAFLARELRHHEAPANVLDAHSPLDQLCARTWQGLQRFNADPYDAEAIAAFDDIWAEIEAAFGVFGPLVVDYQRAMSTITADREAVAADREAVAADRDRVVERLHAEQHAHLAARASYKEAAERAAELGEVVRRDHVARVAERDKIAREQAAATAHIARLERETNRLLQIEASTLWVVSLPLRRLLEQFPGIRRLGRGALKLAWWTATFRLARKLRELRGHKIAVSPGATAAPAHPELGSRSRSARTRVLFISGESHTPGHFYRVTRMAQAAERVGASVSIINVENLGQDLREVDSADLVFIWRATWNPELAALMSAARNAGTPIVFDIDDLAFDPALARTEIIDGIRSQGFTEAAVAEHFMRTRQVLAQADVCTAPTLFLADRLRECGKPTFLLPNTFEEDVLQRSRLAVRRRRAAPPDGLVRIGYATGSKTHQADFAQCAEAVAEVLRAHPEARLVLFGYGDNPAETPVLDIAEFPALAGLQNQIEWRKMVPLAQLPDELARFDISIASLETGNVFCEAKSELKFFEAALVDVPTVASPTEPYRNAIRDGETGFLAADPQAWRDALTRLVEDAGLRRKVAKAAFYDALENFGPERCVDNFYALMEQLLADGRRGARAFELDLVRREFAPAPRPHVPDHEIVFARDGLRAAEVTVVVPLYNYADVVEEALESVLVQTVAHLDLIVVDDASTDDSMAVAQRWLEANADRFNRALLVRNITNVGLGFTRNVGFANAETPFVLPLDADNRLRPRCVEQTLAEIQRAYAAFAYPGIEEFGDSTAQANTQGWLAARLSGGNYVDAMALVRRSAWVIAGGYDHVRHGWEDYDLWCRFAERGMFGVRVPDLLAEYRVHGRSMLRTQTDVLKNKLELAADMERRHPWLRIIRPPEAREARS